MVACLRRRSSVSPPWRTSDGQERIEGHEQRRSRSGLARHRRPPRERAELLLAALTFDEKVAIGLGEFETVEHLGVPALRYTDGPNGIRGPDTVTAFPASLALAAGFDERLAAD